MKILGMSLKQKNTFSSVSFILILALGVLISMIGYSLERTVMAVILPLQVPQGSYTQSCRNIKVSNDTLTASCQNIGGGWVNTSLENFSYCSGGINNDNGKLQCARKSTPVPAGSYKSSCRDSYVKDGTLYSICDYSAGWKNTYLANYKTCVGGIFNDFGQLRCKGGSLPSGSYTKTCQNISINNDTLHAQCDNGKGGLDETTLDQVSQCKGDIGNLHGSLSCSRGIVPSGSYRSSCINPTVSGGTLVAHCEAKSGKLQNASLSGISLCTGDIGNLDGNLTCAKGNVPSGSYRDSCINPTANGSTLTAKCQRKDGSFRETSIDFSKCGAGVGNLDGSLTCQTTGSNSAPKKVLLFAV